MREPSERGTGNRTGSTLFLFYVLPYGFIACRSQKRGMCFAYGKTFVMEMSGFNTLLIGVVN